MHKDHRKDLMNSVLSHSGKEPGFPPPVTTGRPFMKNREVRFPSNKRALR